MDNQELKIIFQSGIEAHQANNLKVAEACYKDVLKFQPDHPDANHNMGLIYFKINEQDKAALFF